MGGQWAVDRASESSGSIPAAEATPADSVSSWATSSSGLICRPSRTGCQHRYTHLALGEAKADQSLPSDLKAVGRTLRHVGADLGHWWLSSGGVMEGSRPVRARGARGAAFALETVLEAWTESGATRLG